MRECAACVRRSESLLAACTDADLNYLQHKYLGRYVRYVQTDRYRRLDVLMGMEDDVRNTRSLCVVSGFANNESAPPPLRREPPSSQVSLLSPPSHLLLLSAVGDVCLAFLVSGGRKLGPCPMRLGSASPNFGGDTTAGRKSKDSRYFWSSLSGLIWG